LDFATWQTPPNLDSHKLYGTTEQLFVTALPNHVPGVPNRLYRQHPDGVRLGFEPDIAVIDQLLAFTDGYDPNAYLSAETMVWFEQTSHELNLPVLHGGHFIINHRPVIPNVFEQLLERARQHQADVIALPRLALAVKPTRGTGLGWEPFARATDATIAMRDDVEEGSWSDENSEARST
jgi:hypothetical protein